MISLNDLLVILPELYLTAAACLVLLFDVFIKDDQRDATHWVAIIVMLVGIFLVIHGQTSQTVTAFGGMFVRDHMAEILKVTVLIATVLMFVMARPWLKDRKLFIGEFMVILSAFTANPWIALFAAYSLIIGAAYTLWLVKRIVWGTAPTAEAAAMPKLTAREGWVLTAFAVAVLAMGVYPWPLMHLMDSSVAQLVTHLMTSKIG